MPGLDCAKHGPRFAVVCCEHAGRAIEERRVVPVYLQPLPLGGEWCTLCEDCVRRVDVEFVDMANDLVCVECVVEWAELAKNNYVQRSKDPRPEFPK